MFKASVQNTYPIICLESIKNNDLVITYDNGVVSLVSLYKTDPEDYLLRLIALKDFSSAETFARTYNLDTKNIKKAKVENIMEKKEYSTRDVDTLLVLLDDVNDVLFTLQCCHHVQYWCQTILDVKRIIEFGCSKVRPSLVDNL